MFYHYSHEIEADANIVIAEEMRRSEARLQQIKSNRDKALAFLKSGKRVSVDIFDSDCVLFA
jgi:hypothetical protein